MARTNNLTNFLTDVASAIKTKKGDNTPIPASDFDTEITNLPSGGNLQDKTYTTNEAGNVVIQKDSGYDGINTLTLNNRVNEGFANNTWNWSSMGLNIPKSLACTKGYNYAVQLYQSWDPDNPYSAFTPYNTQLVYLPNIDTSKVTSFYRYFRNCYALIYLPVISFASATSLQDMFSNCISLSDEALDNILLSCLTVTSTFTGNKKLTTLWVDFLNRYDRNIFENLPHYQDFINSGWTLD